METTLHPECHHSYLLRRVDRLYDVLDGPKGQTLNQEQRSAMLAELRQKTTELNRIES